MKLTKILGLGLGVAVFLGSTGVAFADEEVVATTTPMMQGGTIPFVAGDVDSIHGKGAWFISNKWDAPYAPQTIIYVAEHPEYQSVWKTIMQNLYHIVLQ